MGTTNQFLQEAENAGRKILFAASEIHPLIKTGGLADVAGSLPLAMHELGLDVRLVLPAYPKAVEKLIPLHPIANLKVPGWAGNIRILEGTFAERIPIYLVDIPGLFDRTGNPYLDYNGHDWHDNADRFGAFCRAIVALAMKQTPLDWHPDVVHCNDWQTGLVPALLAQEWDRPATVFTIHNLSYQGIFDQATFQRLRLPPQMWTHHALEFHKQFSFIKGGIAFADRITTVSPSYSEEILTPQLGYGLEGLLAHRAPHLSGVLNGIDYAIWNPETDPSLESNYSVQSLSRKAQNKAALQREFGLPENPAAFLLGHIGRLVEQKGTDLIIESIPRIAQEGNLQLVLLGSGEPEFEEPLQRAAREYPDRIAVRTGYDERLSHRIEAGCDAFLMPSRYEPCGLNQLYSLRYGTPPIVHRTGGLADTVIDATAENVMAGSATGFVCDHATAEECWKTIERAEQYYRRPRMWWEKLAATGMKQDFSWQRSAQLYRAIYYSAIDDPLRNPLAGM